MSNKIAKARNQKVFCVKEPVKGTLVFPTNANLVVAAGYATMNQQPSFSDSEEIEESRDVLERFQDRFSPGSLAIPTYFRPSGAAGTAPSADVLFECLMGKKTITPGVSVVYSQSIEKGSFSYWLQKGHTVFWARGCTVNKSDVGLAKTGGAHCDFSGEFMEMGWAGTDQINGALSLDDTAIVVGDGKKYTVGSYVEFEVAAGTVYNNSDSGYQITGVDVETNTLTIGTGLEVALADDSIIRGFLPVGTKTGAPLESRKGKAQFNGVDTPVQSMSVSINDPAQMLGDEITATDYPEDYAEGARDLSGALAVYFRENDLAYFHDGQNSNQQPLAMVIGDTPGSVVTIALPQSELEVPNVTEADPTVALNMNFKGLGNVGEDSATITFT
jgi:Phage tail tube protein